MGSAIALRDDFDGAALRLLARTTMDAARIGVVGLQVVRDRVLRFNADGPEGLIDGNAWGRPPKLSHYQRQALVRLVPAKRGSEPGGDRVGGARSGRTDVSLSFHRGRTKIRSPCASIRPCVSGEWISPDIQRPLEPAASWSIPWRHFVILTWSMFSQGKYHLKTFRACRSFFVQVKDA